VSDKQKTNFQLRSFIYRDDDTVDEFISQLEGDILEGTYTSKITETGGKSGNVNVGLHGLGAGIGGNTSTTSETSQTLRRTPAWRFSHLYKLLEQDPKQVQFLSQFNQNKYDELNVGQIVELRARLRRIAWERVMEELEELIKYVNLGQKMGLYDPSKDKEAQQIIDQFPNLKATTAPEETLVIATIAAAPAFKFVVKLKDEKLLRKKSALETEALILGKIERKLEKNDKPIDIFRLVPRLAALQKLSRQQRRQLQKQSSSGTEFDESVKYPAIELFPVAIYL